MPEDNHYAHPLDMVVNLDLNSRKARRKPFYWIIIYQSDIGVAEWVRTSSHWCTDAGICRLKPVHGPCCVLVARDD